MLLALGVAEVTAGRAEGESHLREALESARDDGVRLNAALVLAHALGRAERIGPAVEVIDRVAAQLADGDGATRLALESMALGAGMLDAATAPGLAARLQAVRRAADDPAAAREVLGVAALVALHANEPASACIALARRALAAGPRIVPGPTDLPWFAQATIALVWSDAHAEAQVPLDAGVAESRASGDTALFAASHAQRAWLLLRRGDLQGAEADARSVLDAPELAAPAIYRKLAAAVLVNTLVERGELAQAADVLDRAGPDRSPRTQTAAVLQLAHGRLLLARGRPADALAEMLAAGDVARSTGSSCPGYLAWRSAAALAHAALGDRAAALRLANEEVVLARAFGASRTLAVALRTAGVVAPAEEPLRESVACAGAGLERARALAELGALLRRGNRRVEAAPAAARGARGGPPRRRRAAGGPRRVRAPRHRRPAAAGGAHRRRGPHGQRAARRRARGRRPHEPRDRPGALRDHAHRGGAPHERLRQARPGLARRAARRAREALALARRHGVAGSARDTDDVACYFSVSTLVGWSTPKSMNARVTLAAAIDGLDVAVLGADGVDAGAAEEAVLLGAALQRVVAALTDEHDLEHVGLGWRRSRSEKAPPRTSTTLSNPVVMRMSMSPSMSRSTAGPIARPPVWSSSRI